MFDLFSKLKHSTFLKDNVILFAGTFLTGVLGFFYHFYMGRVLSVSDYGILGTILAGFYLFNAAFVNTVQTSIAKFTSEFNSKKEEGKIAYLFFRSFRKLFLAGAAIYVLYLLSVPFFSNFLRIDKTILFMAGLLLILSLLVPVGRGVLQGLQNFKALSLNLLVEGVSKLTLGILFVYLSFQVMGALVAVILSLFIPLLFFAPFLRKYGKVQRTSFMTKHVYIYSFPVFLMIVSLTLFFSIDVILVKHFFTETEAGFYSALSLLGKIIFFGTISISQVMFPKVSESLARGEKTLKLFLKSLLVTLFCLICALFVYIFFPKLLVLFLFGNKFLLIVGLVGWFGIFISLICIIYLLSFYLISLKQFKFIFILFLFNMLQVYFLLTYHRSLSEVVFILNILMVFLLLSLLSVVLYTHRNTFKKSALSFP